MTKNKNEYQLCCDCQYCGDKYSFPLPNDKIEVDPENPLLKHFYCCCGDCELYEHDVTSLGVNLSPVNGTFPRSFS